MYPEIEVDNGLNTLTIKSRVVINSRQALLEFVAALFRAWFAIDGGLE